MQQQQSRNNAVSAVVVAVTYGDRLHLVRQVVAGALRFVSVVKIIIVDNGSKRPVAASDFDEPEKVEVLRSETNLGSAAGFRLGIERALALEGVRYLSLLDDDNVVGDGYYDELARLHEELGGGDEIAFSAIRTDREQYKRLLSQPQHPSYLHGSFLGFDVAAIAKRLAGRIMKTARPASPSRLRAIDRAPYGGLFLTLAAARRIDPPRLDFVLYGDDHEYTRRLTRAGVTIYLTDHAHVVDVDQSWNEVNDRGSRWIDVSAPQWRIYYAARNQHFLELSEAGGKAALRMNRLALKARLYAEALARHRSPSKAARAMRTLNLAIRHAKRGQLGANEEFRIPFSSGN
ncbi:GT2 family glycosyltransferase [Sphingomonas sp. BE138]|uniref:glycosyltransferase n=1 Tax=Sphingomonas sp. BE138 TaxID=2817845 RepID=UPI0028555DDF|nr:glycosyltransferase [Sphingomonas sp. BE138]MDR6790419.1 GT2 family glycosyltransferase [Sphingomonas sp. BE138]